MQDINCLTKSSIDFIHNIERRGLVVVEGKDEGQG